MAVGATSPQERKRHTGKIEWANGQVIRARDIAAEVVRVTGYSAYADQEVRTAPVVFVQHGEDPQRGGLACALKARAASLSQELTVVRPQPCINGSWYNFEIESSQG